MVEDISKRLYMPDAGNYERFINRKYFSDKELEVKTLNDGIILPPRKMETSTEYSGGVCDNDFNFVAGYFCDKKGGWGSVISSYAVERENITHCDEDVIFGGTLILAIGHFMTECWGRLWYILQHPELKLRVAFIVSVGGSWGKVFNPFFELLNIPKERIIYVKQPTQFKSVIIPEESVHSRYFYTKEYLVPYEYIKSRVEPGRNKKLYLTRTAYESDKRNSVHIFGEKYFEEFFEARGFKVVSMEKLPIAEQVALISGADEIAATMGTLTHWALFCKPGTKFIMLSRMRSHVLRLQILINLVSCIDWCIVDVSKNFMYAEWVKGACLLGSSSYWKQFVRDYFGEDVQEDDDYLTFEDSLKDYIKFWCAKYCNADNMGKCIETFETMCDRIIALEHKNKATRPWFRYRVHVGKLGWLSEKLEKQVCGDTEQLNDIQAIVLGFSSPYYDVRYAVYYPKEGWSEEVSSDEIAGTTGRAKSIMGIKIRLDESGASKFDIFYRLHAFKNEWSPWAKNGEELISLDSQLNAIQIKLIERITPPHCD